MTDGRRKVKSSCGEIYISRIVSHYYPIFMP